MTLLQIAFRQRNDEHRSARAKLQDITALPLIKTKIILGQDNTEMMYDIFRQMLKSTKTSEM